MTPSRLECRNRSEGRRLRRPDIIQRQPSNPDRGNPNRGFRHGQLPGGASTSPASSGILHAESMLGYLLVIARQRF
jgi:hypothetical protein